MTSRTAKRRRLQAQRKTVSRLLRTVRMTERVVYAPEKRRVDAEKGVIFDVKILGHHSENGRYYTRQAMEQAIPRYEGAFVNYDHPDEPTDPRSSRDRTAWLESVRYVEGDGLRGNLHFLLPLDKQQEKIIWAAEHKPNAYTLSHNADGKGREDDRGTFVIEAITELRSVDIVQNGATTKSLFEGRTIETTLRKLLESIKVPAVLESQKIALLEIDDDMGDMAVAEPPAESAGDWRSTLGRVAGELAASEDPEAHDIARKIMTMLKPASATNEEEDDDNDKKDKEMKEEEEDDEKDKSKTESRKHKTSGVSLTEDRAKRLCKLAGINPDPELLEAMTGSSEETGLKLLEWAKGKASGTTPGNGKHTRSTPAGSFQPGKAGGKGAANLDEFEKRICGRVG